MSDKERPVIYTGEFVKDPNALLEQLTPHDFGEGTKVFAHHLTREFKPEEGAEGIVHGKESTLRAIGHVVSKELGIHAVIVELEDGDSLGSSEHPHITMSTAEGAKPFESYKAIAAAKEAGTVIPIEPPVPIEVVQGHFDGKEIHTGPEADISVSRGRGVPIDHAA